MLHTGGPAPPRPRHPAPAAAPRAPARLARPASYRRFRTWPSATSWERHRLSPGHRLQLGPGRRDGGWGRPPRLGGNGVGQGTGGRRGPRSPRQPPATPRLRPCRTPGSAQAHGLRLPPPTRPAPGPDEDQEEEEEERGREARPPSWSRVRTQPAAGARRGEARPGGWWRRAGGRGLDSRLGEGGARTEGCGWPRSGRRGGEGPAIRRLGGDRALGTAGSSSWIEVAKCLQWEDSPA